MVHLGDSAPNRWMSKSIGTEVRPQLSQSRLIFGGTSLACDDRTKPTRRNHQTVAMFFAEFVPQLLSVPVWFCLGLSLQEVKCCSGGVKVW